MGNPTPGRSLLRRTLGGVVLVVRKFAALILLLLVVLLALRAWQSTQGPSLRAWHKVAPVEMDAHDIAQASWAEYVAAEQRMFDEVHRDLQDKMEAGDRTPLNRYVDGSLASPMAFGRDWNRSFVLEPAGEVRGVAVMLHGLTDAPYSMRSLADVYRRHGYVAIVPRMPGHGTVPAGLTREGRKEWEAATEMAMREAARRAQGRVPVHLVGYSNGGALAVLHVMRRIARGERNDVERVVLVSPMIEVNAFARYAGLAGLPSFFPRFARSAWLDVLPEFNAFKYNSFPVRAARESYLVTSDVSAAIADVAAQGRMDRVPPILAFQSVVDDTVNAPAVATRLFDALPANGSELVLFDVNRNRVLAPILRTNATQWSQAALQGPARRYTVTVIGTASPDDASVVARTRPAGSTHVQVEATTLRYPADVYSLSHVALPFPADDPLYGNVPTGRAHLQLGTVAVRGERNTLAVSQDSLNRLSWNPFHDDMAMRIEAVIR
ncbi:alpha/beta fold hydrolase [Lysobacter sp. A6]|uniref:Alpha/beta fold hydrolase n=1 Tax=Noviluteimonas lactosilytica TaxID=2888523 RepID=A0ABS8JG07_9GAMM|nr:alpha/beta fold hydrolase [Lysobacter lactosilyticus]MCC8362430.1 alpha/beta fold hydrolase [Lysobacter lactosilyticus]